MSHKWLNVYSFERSYQLVSAINTITIHTELELLGVDDRARLPAVEQACGCLLKFLEEFEGVVEQVESNEDRIAIGVDPRLTDLARGLSDARRQRPSTLVLASTSFAQLRNLLTSTDSGERTTLVKCLRELRRLVEEHAHVDAVRILGEL